MKVLDAIDFAFSIAKWQKNIFDSGLLSNFGYVFLAAIMYYVQTFVCVMQGPFSLLQRYNQNQESKLFVYS